MDVKAAHTGPRAIQSFKDWVATAKPAYLSFWSLRIGTDSDESTCRSILGSLKSYCDDVAAFFYRAGDGHAQYRALRFNDFSMDRALNEFVQRIRSHRSSGS